MTLSVCTWLWGDKYDHADVAKLANGVRRHLRREHRFVVVTDRVQAPGFNDALEQWCLPIEDIELTTRPGCFARLRMFDLAWQMRHGIERIACLDLDSVVTGPLDDIFAQAAAFQILRGANASNPCPYNGSVMMLLAGAYPEIWRDFNLAAASRIRAHEFPDDQGWIWHKLGRNVSGWQVGPSSGIYAFQKPGWPKGEALPADARLVVFPGWRSPEKFKHLDWVKRHWQ